MKWLKRLLGCTEASPAAVRIYRIETGLFVLELPESALPIWHRYGTPGAKITLVE